MTPLKTSAEWFRGLRATRKPKDNAPVDDLLAQQFHLLSSPTDQKLSPDQRARRDALERAAVLHREKKKQLSEDEYYRELERLLLELGRFYESNSVTTAIPPSAK